MKRSVSSTVRFRLEDAGLRMVSLALGPLGWRGSQRLGAFLGGVAYRLVPIRSEVTRRNIARAYAGSMTTKEVDSLAGETYRSLGKTFFEVARFGSMSREEVQERVRFDHPEILDGALKEGKGALLVTGHFGNFDLFGAAIAARGSPLSVLVQRQSNPIVDERVRRYREKMGSRVIYRGAGVREVVRALRRNEFVAIVADQDARGSGIFVDFLGTPASTAKGPALLAYRTGAPIVFGTLERLSDGSHIGRLERPIRARSEMPEEDEVRRVTEEWVARLEGAVRQRPDHYFWPHKRWKTKRPGARNG